MTACSVPAPLWSDFSYVHFMQNSVCPPCGGGTLKCSCRKELGDQLQLVRSMLGEIAERSDTCHTITDVTTIGDLRCECACGVQLVPETSAALFIKRTAPRIIAVIHRNVLRLEVLSGVTNTAFFNLSLY